MFKYMSLLLLILTGCSTTQPLPNRIENQYPKWVLAPKAYYGIYSASSCYKISESDEYKSRKIAEQAARLKLIKEIGGEQLMHATEKVTSTGEKNIYSSNIKLKTYGKIGRNEILQQKVVKLSEKKREICVVVGLI